LKSHLLMNSVNRARSLGHTIMAGRVRKRPRHISNKTSEVRVWREGCLPALQHDPNRPEDVLKVDADEDGNGGDDAADCLRYLVATKSRVVAQRKLRGL
jgi:hypothetical protein